MAPHVAACGLMTGAMLLASGCARPSVGAPTRLTPRANLYVADVPVPRGFSLNEGRSMHEVDQVANARRIDHCYEGGEAIGALRNFYIDQMPRFGWRLLKEEQVEAVYSLDFEKETEACSVQIQRGGSGALFSPAQIRVRINARDASEVARGAGE